MTLDNHDKKRKLPPKWYSKLETKIITNIGWWIFAAFMLYLLFGWLGAPPVDDSPYQPR